MSICQGFQKRYFTIFLLIGVEVFFFWGLKGELLFIRQPGVNLDVQLESFLSINFRTSLALHLTKNIEVCDFFWWEDGGPS